MPIPCSLASQFPILEHLVFLNHAAVAPISATAATALRRYADQAVSRSYFSSEWYSDVEKVRCLAAQLVNSPDPAHIAFVANTSTGLSMVAGGLDWTPGDNVVITGIEYPANRYPWEHLKHRGVELIEVRPDHQGRIYAEQVADAITDRTCVVSVSHVQYSNGHQIQIKQISDMAHRAGSYLCVDAIQSIGVMPVDVQAMGIDFLAADGHKWMLGPEGCGIFYCRGDLIELLRPPVVGWMCMVDADNYGDYRCEFRADARRFEPGSYNIAGIVALGASIALLLECGIDAIWSRVEALTQHLCEGLAARSYTIVSPRREAERSGIVAFDPPATGPSPDQIVAQLQEQNIIIAVREEHLRASPHFYNTEAQIDQLLEALV